MVGPRAQVKPEFKEIVLSARQDDFFRKNMYANFGEVGIAVKVRVAHVAHMAQQAHRYAVNLTSPAPLFLRFQGFD